MTGASMRIFLSHKSRDKELVRAVKERLPEFLQPWLDDESLYWSASLRESLRKEINANSDFVIIFLGPDTLTSEWVKMELREALVRETELGRTFVLPVVVEWNKDKAMPPELDGRLYLELARGSRGVERLAEDIVLKLFQLVAANLWASDRELSAVPPDRKLLLKALCNDRSKDNFWLRPMLKQPLPNRVFENLIKVLHQAVAVAANQIRPVPQRAGHSKVRANIFLPSSQGIANGDVCTLSIPERFSGHPTRLQVNMEDERELSIIFRPNNGATGKVYAERSAVGRVVHPNWLNASVKDRRSIDRWVDVDLNPRNPLDSVMSTLKGPSGNADLELNSYVNERVNLHLKWIVSTPILVMFNGRPEVIGTFTVDGVGRQISPAILRQVFYAVAPLAGVVGSILRDKRFEHVAILKAQGDVDV